MIDIENQVFDTVAKALRAEHPTVWVTGEIVRKPPEFPAVMLVELGNATYRRTQTSGSMENHVDLTYEVDVYSNKGKGRKSECRALAKTVDRAMADMGFTRTFLRTMPNLADPAIYRITGRYEAIVDQNETVYRR